MIKDTSAAARRLHVVGDDSKRYWLSLLGPLAVGLSLGLQLTVTALLLLGPVRENHFSGQLTQYGKSAIRPEHDLSIYAIGVLFTLCLTLGAAGWWRGKLKRIAPEHLTGFMRSGAWLQGAAAAASMILYLLLMFSPCALPSGTTEPPGKLDSLVLLLPGVLAVAWIALDLRPGGSIGASGLSLGWQRVVDKLLRYAMPVFIILVLGVPPPAWRYLAGQIFMVDGCHHLSFFAMGPAISFAHGKAFGTEIYSQYGIGWPLVFSALSQVGAMTYGNLVGLEIIYGCIYYVALYFVLRSCFERQMSAVIGVILAIYWQIFSGMNANEIIWLFPSSTMMRHPMDVWFFLALVMHQRSTSRWWIAGAGFMSALGIFFETEAGMYLLVTFGVYWVLQTGVAPDANRPSGKSSRFVGPCLFLAAVAATLLPLLFYASRRTLFTTAFWGGWMEAIIQYASRGVGALPIAELAGASLISFMIMVALYVGVIAWAVIRRLHGSVGKGEVLLATLAAYGLALLLLFVSRSHPYNLCHAAVPFAILLAALLSQCRPALAIGFRCSSFQHIWAGGLLVLLLTKAEFLRYPSLVGSLFQTAPPGNLSLVSSGPDISGLPPETKEFVQEFNRISSIVQTLSAAGETVAILDLNDTLLYCTANAKPWSRYSCLFYMALTRQFVDEIRNSLIEARPKWVVIQRQDSTWLPAWDFVSSPLHEIVKGRYVLRQTAGSYEVWRLPDPS